MEEIDKCGNNLAEIMLRFQGFFSIQNGPNQKHITLPTFLGHLICPTESFVRKEAPSQRHPPWGHKIHIPKFWRTFVIG
jgi:hypothetical protein